MDHFIIGDIHGCYHTLLAMLEHWDNDSEHLVLVGDLIDRGKFSAKVVQLMMRLSDRFDNITIIKGNHEVEAIEYFLTGDNPYWLPQGGYDTLADLANQGMSEQMVLMFFQSFALKYETENFLVTHAGVAIGNENPFDESNMNGVIWNRKPLQNIGKLQIHGHSPLHNSQAKYDKQSNSWNIDTGACYGDGLTGLKMSESNDIEVVYIETDSADTTNLSINS